MKLTRRKALVLIPLALILTTTITYGLTISPLSPLRISLFSGQVAASNFIVQSQNVQFQGPNKMKITVTLLNTDTTNSHSANVTVSALNSSGNVLASSSQLTGTVAASGTVTLTYTLSQTGISAAYASTFIQVEDLS